MCIYAIYLNNFITLASQLIEQQSILKKTSVILNVATNPGPVPVPVPKPAQNPRVYPYPCRTLDRHGINGGIRGVESNIVRYDDSERKNI